MAANFVLASHSIWGRMAAKPDIADSWSPAAWREYEAAQQPHYTDQARLAAVERELAAANAIVRLEDCADLRTWAARVEGGDGFILQGGDCAETLGQPQLPVVTQLSQLFDQLGAELPKPLVNIARIAGQFAKPRSNPVEQRGALALPAYRGDGINRSEYTAAARRPDPTRMIDMHAQSSETARLLGQARAGRTPIFTSHEALLLPYEQALARRDPQGRWWATSGHMLWVGDRSRQVDGAHVAFVAGIENLVGVKCGPRLGADELLSLLDRIDPGNRPGKIALIGRFGADSIEQRLPPLMKATKGEGRRVLWMIDPMHGNGRIQGSRKVRWMDDMAAETRAFFAIAQAQGVHPAGLHLEMSADDIVECDGPDEGSGEGHNFQSLCDPRLNAGQAALLVRTAAGRVAEPA